MVFHLFLGIIITLLTVVGLCFIILGIKTRAENFIRGLALILTALIMAAFLWFTSLF